MCGNAAVSDKHALMAPQTPLRGCRRAAVIDLQLRASILAGRGSVFAVAMSGVLSLNCRVAHIIG